MNRQSVIDLAVQLFNKHKHLRDEAYSVDDSLRISLENHHAPTMNSTEYDQLLKEVYEAV